MGAQPTRPPAAPFLAGFALAAAVLVAIQAIRHGAYWNYSEGVYAYTSRALIEGDDVYGDVIAAQPPSLFLSGGALLAIHDSLGWLRFGVGLVQLAGALLAAVVVWRLTASRWGTAVAAPLALLTPWAVHENGQLTPELFAPPLLLGAVLLASRPRGSGLGGALAGLAPFFKFPFALPLLAVVAFAGDRRRALVGAAAALVAQVLVFTLVFGTDLWTQSVVAQVDSGRRFDGLGGYVGQSAWNLAGLVAAAAVAVAARRRARDDRLFLLTVAVAAAMLLTLLTVTKRGTTLNVLAAIEPVLVPLAVAGLVWGLEWLRDGQRAGRARLAAGAAVALVLLSVVQSVSLLASPDEPRPFLRPGSVNAWGQALSSDDVDAEVARTRACDPRLAYSGPPFIAFVAGRRMPAAQPDQFITTTVPRFREVAARMRSDVPFCPWPALPPGQ